MTSDPFEEPLNFSGPTQPERRTKYPWELSAKGSEYVNKICRTFLVRIFLVDMPDRSSPKAKFGYDFEANGMTYSIRSNCLAEGNRSWKFNFGSSNAKSFLFFGFRNIEKPTLEFCMDIPREKFRNKTHITIHDDDYHIKGYKEFWIDSKKFEKMLEVMAAIEDKDASKIEEFFPRLYDGLHYVLE